MFSFTILAKSILDEHDYGKYSQPVTPMATMRILMLNMYFTPDRAASALIFEQLACHLSKHHTIEVLCAHPSYNPLKSQKPFSFKVTHAGLFSFSRHRIVGRALNYIFYLIGALFIGLFKKKPDVIIAMTDPPFNPWIAHLLKLRFDSKLIIVCQDLYPDIAVALKKLNHPVFIQWIDQINTHVFKSADQVVAIGRDMQERLKQKGIPNTRSIENWSPIKLHPCDKNIFRKRNNIDHQSFLIMHSGNMGYSQQLDELIDVARQLKDHKDIVFCLVGDGANKQNLIHKSRDLENVLFLPYQSNEDLSESLSAADVHFVSLKEELKGLIVPSKIYGILSVARAIIAMLPANCDTRKIIEESQSGFCVQLSQLAYTLIDLKQKKHLLDQMGQNGLQWIENRFKNNHPLEKYSQLVRELIEPSLNQKNSKQNVG